MAAQQSHRGRHVGHPHEPRDRKATSHTQQQALLAAAAAALAAAALAAGTTLALALALATLIVAVLRGGRP